MYKHILIATDGSDLAGKALIQGLALAKDLAAKVTIVTVTEPWPTQMIGEAAIAFPFEDYEAAVTANAAEILSKAGEVASKAGISCERVHVKERYPSEGILETAKSRGCDLIVMASHGRRGLTRLMLGSQANDVVTHSTLPVLICR
jgi:nucleotide-binding universal stress UspA family protein